MDAAQTDIVAERNGVKCPYSFCNIELQAIDISSSSRRQVVRLRIPNFEKQVNRGVHLRYMANEAISQYFWVYIDIFNQ